MLPSTLVREFSLRTSVDTQRISIHDLEVYFHGMSQVEPELFISMLEQAQAHSADDLLPRPTAGLSGGERQSVAIARAGYFGAKVLILDEPTSALGVKQSGVVLRRIVEARNQGLAVIFITHNPSHAYPVGDRFLILNRGQSMGNFAKDDITLPELTQLMAGGAELEQLQHELEQAVSGGGGGGG